jgi:UDP-glucose 4-epimerase
MGDLGERHDPETHLIPLVLQTISGRRDSFSVFGRDYGTEDGTCVRDYIHVSDLCDAHWLAIQYLLDGGDSQCFNLGNGSGFSVQEVIYMCEKVTGKELKVIESGRREGDPAVLVADSSFASQLLGWNQKFGNLEDIIRHAWLWEKKS